MCWSRIEAGGHLKFVRRFNALWHPIHPDAGSENGLLHDGFDDSEMSEQLERAWLEDSEHQVTGCHQSERTMIAAPRCPSLGIEFFSIILTGIPWCSRERARIRPDGPPPTWDELVRV